MNKEIMSELKDELDGIIIDHTAKMKIIANSDKYTESEKYDASNIMLHKMQVVKLIASDLFFRELIDGETLRKICDKLRDFWTEVLPHAHTNLASEFDASIKNILLAINESEDEQ